MAGRAVQVPAVREQRPRPMVYCPPPRIVDGSIGASVAVAVAVEQAMKSSASTS
jgi:hypothetical protein